jgi:hypothetical protein
MTDDSTFEFGLKVAGKCGRDGTDVIWGKLIFRWACEGSHSRPAVAAGDLPTKLWAFHSLLTIHYSLFPVPYPRCF